MLILKREETAVLIVFLLSALAALCYLAWGCLVYVPRRKRLGGVDADERYDGCGTFVIRFLVMLLCPVVGPCFFLMGYVSYRIFFYRKTDLADVIFKKGRSRQFLKDDVEKEHNMASLEETLLLGDTQDERSLMMSVIQRDLSHSLSAILLALKSEDSETSHYAASALQDVFSDFRITVRKLSGEIAQEREDEYRCEEKLIDYMREVLRQNIFTKPEQKRYVAVFEGAGEKLFFKHPESLTVERYEDIIQCLLGQEEFERAAVWCERLAKRFPMELCAYKCRLKLCYMTGNRERFFALLEEFKRQDIMYDNEIIQIMSVFE